MSEDISTPESAGQEASGSAGGAGSLLTDVALGDASAVDGAAQEGSGNKLSVATDDGGAGTAQPAPDAVPEAYEFVGAEELDPGVVDAFKDFSKSSGLNNKQAQAVLDLAVSQNKATQEALVKQEQQWRTQLLSEPDIGGDNIKATVGYAQRALRHFGASEALIQDLDRSGYGSRPDAVRFLYNIGRSISEDTPPSAGISGKEELPLHERMYPPTK